MPDKLESMGEPEEDGPREDASASPAATASEVKRSNDATMALSESEFLALQVPAAAPPAIPAGKPARASSPVSRNDASMWAGSVLVADEFEPLVVPKKPLGRWLFVALFGLGLVGAALYFLWWQPTHEVAAAEPPEVAGISAAAKPAEGQAAAPVPAAAPAPAPASPAESAPPPAAEPPAAEPAAAIAPEKPAAAPPPVKKTASKKKSSSSKKKKSSKKKTSSKKTKKKKKTSRGG